MFNATSLQFKFQQTVPKWSVNNQAPISESDDHFNRHLETVENEQDEEELNSEPVDSLDDEKDEDQPTEDEPKVFQDEEVLDDEISDPVLLKKSDPPKSNASQPMSKLTSVMPTPLAYSRSSSLTSLNSFDVKSIHSTVESEYSHVPKKPGDCSQLDISDEEIDNLMPDSPAAPDSSFLKAQRTIHKIKQAECRQNAWKISNDLNTIMSKMAINEQPKLATEQNTPPIKLAPVPKFLQQSNQAVPPPVMSVAYGFLKNANPPLINQPPPKFLLSSNSHHNSIDDSPKVYSTVRPKPESPRESICSRMSDASLPSVIKQDMVTSRQQFNTTVNNSPNFKALFDKLNVPKTENYSSSSSGSSCSSVIPKLNEDMDEDDEQNSFLNTTTKPMNTPAGFASAAGLSLLEDPDETTDSSKQVSKSGECLYIDFDLENFIKENFQPSFEQEDKKTSKRASLQSLDVNLTKTKSKNANLNKKRLSEDNLKIATGLVKKNETRGSRTSSASVSTSIGKTVGKSQPPVVNMTRTAQLRASKMIQNKNNVAEKKLPITSKTSKTVKTTDRFNTTVNENNDGVQRPVASSSRRFSTGQGSSLAKKDTHTKKPVLSTHNKDLNSTLTCKSNLAKSSRPLESARSIGAARIQNSSRTVTKLAK